MESKTYVFNPESGTSGTGSNGILAMLPALMQRPRSYCTLEQPWKRKWLG